jgi:site-specific DNA-methyltransferase (adenine-specific)
MSDVRGEYRVQPMSEWDNLSADFLITDPPFGIGFDGKQSNYNRDDGRVVDGYVEWDSDQYRGRINDLLSVATENTHSGSQACIFSGWNNSHHVHAAIESSDVWALEGKLYWNYNFAPYCTRRPAHNVYEIYWMRRGDSWTYDNECTHTHCTEGEANLAAIDVKREYISEMPKYPTRLPPEIVRVLLEHFTEEGDTVFDPLAGSGTVGLVAEELGRDWFCGDSNREGKRVFTETCGAVSSVCD